MVPPHQLLLEEYVPIAWTQRVEFTTDPPPALRRRWMNLGKPSVEEVVEHLVRLTTEIGRDLEGVYAWNNGFIGDLRQTYQHLQFKLLQQRDQEVQPVSDALSGYSEVPIFLNVENPQSCPWVWASAEELVLDIEVHCLFGILHASEAMTFLSV